MSKVEKRQYVSDLKIKDNVDGVFLVKSLSLLEGRDGRAYLNLILCDASGEMECRVWQNAEETSLLIRPGQFVNCKGKVNLYQGRKQVVIQEISELAAEVVNESDFVVKSAQDPEEMFARLLSYVEQLDDVYIRDLLREILADTDIVKKLKTWPAGRSIHHAYRSGLLEHILGCVQLSVQLSVFYNVNVNFVVAGAILHDLCKIYELSGDIGPEYTEEGKLVGHLTKGIEIVERFSHRIRHFPYYTKLHLKHIILAHHGQYEYGSPKLPQTSEAYLVHLIDYMDSKMHSLEMIKKTDNNVGPWSNYIKHMDRIIYKGKLPHYTDYIPERPERSLPTETEQPHKMPQEHANKNPTKRQQGPKELKQNMSKLLEGFKVDS